MRQRAPDSAAGHGARQAWEVEARQISDGPGLNPLVWLTDHDAIDAPLALRALGPTRDAPVSAEWTVPFRDTFFHIGVHNLPPERAQELFARMRAYTTAPAGRFAKRDGAPAQNRHGVAAPSRK
jgi:hypothetical protein